MAFLRSVTNTTRVAIPASALPDFSALSPSPNPKPQNLLFLSPSTSLLYSTASGLVKNLTRPPSALNMETPTSNHKPISQDNVTLPEIVTEFMVDMKCEGCVNSVKNKLQSVDVLFCIMGKPIRSEECGGRFGESSGENPRVVSSEDYD
ncbi:hypothetical protein OIU84_022313 [Salix udensis]|uniref:HMA domain-containing protein n=1 Tax=Salix udensis TaxID=889485 RepID=A0AAD6KQK6_9ROSI|nr:hypothetical protein OIU84_022313 [Salix udensis]